MPNLVWIGKAVLMQLTCRKTLTKNLFLVTVTLTLKLPPPKLLCEFLLIRAISMPNLVWIGPAVLMQLTCRKTLTKKLRQPQRECNSSAYYLNSRAKKNIYSTDNTVSCFLATPLQIWTYKPHKISTFNPSIGTK